MNIIKFLFRMTIAILEFIIEVLACAITTPAKKPDPHHEWQDGRARLKMANFDSVAYKISTGEL